MNAMHTNTNVIGFVMTPVLQFFKFFVGEEGLKISKRKRLRLREIGIHIFMLYFPGINCNIPLTT